MTSTTSSLLPDGSIYCGEYTTTSSSTSIQPHGLGTRLYLAVGNSTVTPTTTVSPSAPSAPTSPSTTATNNNTQQKIYIGEWENGNMHGRGLLLQENGDIYEGLFDNGNYHGRGFLYSRKEERSKRGTWKQGQLLQVEDVIGNADDANYHVKFHSGKHETVSTRDVPHFKLMQLEAATMTMRDLKRKLEQQSLSAAVSSSPPSSTNQTLLFNNNNSLLTQPSYGNLEKQQQQQSTAAFESSHTFLSARTNSNLGSTKSLVNNMKQLVQHLDSSPSQQQYQQQQTNFENTQNNYNTNNTVTIACDQNQNQNQNNNNKDSYNISPEPFGNVPANAPVHDQILSNQLLLTVSGPSYNFSFSVVRFVQFFSLFVFPFLSLPGIPVCPLRMDGIDLEREYVVSGAALRADFELPSWEIYFDAISILFLIVAGGISSNLFAEGVIGFETPFAWSDVIIPAVLIFIFCLLQAAYQSFHRTAHALERLDRHHFPRLAALSGQCIDANCHTLVVSWDEEGLGRVMNKKYKYKWATIGLVYGFLLGFAAPIIRMIRGQSAFATETTETEASAILCFLATWIISSGITYEFWRILDLERQLDETMTVLTRCAYLKGQSILRPSDNRKFKFHFDSPVSMTETNSGFLGWYITRSFSLYASTLSNHRSRHAFVSMLAAAAIAIDTAIIIDTFRSLDRQKIVFTTAHGFAIFVILGWGPMLLRFLYVANGINQEVRKHLYLADVAGMYHLFKDPQAANIISRCRSMIAEHDYSTKVLGVRISDKVLATSFLFHGLAIGCMIVSIVMWGYDLKGMTNDLLKF